MYNMENPAGFAISAMYNMDFTPKKKGGLATARSVGYSRSIALMFGR
jgi:hypothetical protein